MGGRGTTGGRRAAVAGAVAALLAVGACSSADCSFDSCPEVAAAEAGRVSGADPTGTVRWTTTVPDLLDESASVSNGHLVLRGCHATHVIDAATGAVSTPGGLERVLGVVGGYAVGVPTDDDVIAAAEPLDGGPGGWSWSEAPVDQAADRGYRTSAVVTTDGLVGVRGRTLVAWSARTGSWERVDVPLPVGAWRDEGIVVLDATHIAVPGSDGSVVGVDLATQSVVWRSLPTRPDLPADIRVRLEGPDLAVEVRYPRTSAPAITGEAVWVSERWSLDGRTGAAASPRTTSTGPLRDRVAPAPTQLRDPASGWTLTLQLRDRPRGGCF